MKTEIDKPDNRPLPLVTQVGFAGARLLFVPEEHAGVEPDVFNDAVAEQLSALLQTLPGELGLPPSDFLCGISALAIGGDMAFTRACQTLEMPQRLFLPQHLDAFLDAGNKHPDFSPDQRDTAKALQASEHIIETRVVSDAHHRHDRFHDTNLEIANTSDVVICLVRAGQTHKSGGTLELVDVAARQGKPACVVEVAVGDGGLPALSKKWLSKDKFAKPELSAHLSDNLEPLESTSAIPDGTAYCKHIKQHSSDNAKRSQGQFKRAAWIIVGGHVLATVLALVAMHNYANWVFLVLGVEIMLLGTGLAIHHRLHRNHAIGRWAMFRLLGEVSRSVLAIDKVHVYLEHFFKLTFPDEIRPLLRTINVLHLSDSATESGDWQTQRFAYVDNRLRSHNAQLEYNRRTHAKAKNWMRCAQVVFYLFSILAIAATLLKLSTLLGWLPPEGLNHCIFTADTIKTWSGSFAVLFPVIAVAALSLAAAFDLEAKAHTSEEMLNFLNEQEALLNRTTSPREFARLVIETETRLLGETANWYARRSFVGVA